jgi:hypothetical protein
MNGDHRGPGYPCQILRSTRYGKHNLYLMNRQFWVCRTVGLELWRATFIRSETCSRSRIAYRRRHHGTRTPTASHQDVSDIVASGPADYAVDILRRRRRAHNRSPRRGPTLLSGAQLEKPCHPLCGLQHPDADIAFFVSGCVALAAVPLAVLLRSGRAAAGADKPMVHKPLGSTADMIETELAARPRGTMCRRQRPGRPRPDHDQRPGDRTRHRLVDRRGESTIFPGLDADPTNPQKFYQ